jgi:acylphosphatase
MVYGRVQGVGFRITAQEAAWRLDLLGWVRNRSCGERVEMVVEGDIEPVETFLRWCGDGPPGAEIERVEISTDDGHEALKPFAILPTF